MPPPPDPLPQDPAQGFQELLKALCVDVAEGTQSVSVGTTDVFGQMCVLFVARQLDHAESLVKLNDHPDASLIVRSMLEGFCQLKWTEGDPLSRGARWEAFIAVTNWRRLQRRLADGLAVAAQDVASVDAALDPHRLLFYTAEAEATIRKKKTLPPDPFVDSWTGFSFWKLCSSIGAAGHYNWTYKLLSDWHHWAPATMMASVNVSGASFSYAPPHAQLAPGLFLVACQSVLEVAQTADRHLKLGLTDLLKSHETALVAYAALHRPTSPPAP